MTANGWFQIALYFLLIVLIARPLGIYMASVFERRRTFLDPVLLPVERILYKLTGVDADKEMRWTEYGIAMLLFSLVSMLVLYLIERVQS
ncbi:MAG: potassium-transporting ATPase subunit KdpA, partial [Acidobacteriaceae bacterium]